VAGADEETPGGFLCVNDDDDDNNGIADKDDPGPTVGEDDLMAVTVTADGRLEGTLTLSAISGASMVKLYENPDRSTPVTLPQSWPLLGLQKTFTITYYAEGIAPSTATRDVGLSLTFAGAGGPCDDTVKLTVIDVEVEINDTPAQNDDVVRVKSDVPVIRSKVACRARVVGSPAADVVVVLANPNGRMRFPESADATKTLTLPRTGAWVAFEISGESASAALDDAIIVVHLDTATGSDCGSEDVTVFSFDPSGITVTADARYNGALMQDNSSRYTAIGGPAVRFSGEATLNPAGLDCTIPQISDLRIGIMQNSVSMEHATTYDSPSISWSPGVPSGTVVTVPSTLRHAFTVAPVRNDSRPSAAPLYDQPGLPDTLDQNSLKPPIGCPGGAAATSEDTPWVPFEPFLPTDGFDAQGNIVGQVLYLNRVDATLNDSFRTWVVCFDTLTGQVIPLRETTWTLDVAFAVAGMDRATPSGTDANPTKVPVEAPPYTNDDLNDQANESDSGVGADMTTFVHP